MHPVWQHVFDKANSTFGIRKYQMGRILHRGAISHS